MANLPESSIWGSTITQLDSNEKLSGGVTGVLNRSSEELGNRTKYLYDDNREKFHDIDVTVSGSTTTIDLENYRYVWVNIDADNISTTLSFSNIDAKTIMILQIRNIVNDVILPSSFDFGNTDASVIRICNIIFECETIDNGTIWWIREEWKESRDDVPYELWDFGNNQYGQLGVGNRTNRSSPVQVGNITDWSLIGGGEFHSLAIKTDRTLWAWGRNSYGQLGQGNRTHRSSPVQVGSLTDWRYISAGGKEFTLAIKTDGTLWSWGKNTHGELGQGNRTYRSSPVQVGSLTDWKYISAGEEYSLAIKTDGTLWSWGINTHGQLGVGNRTHRSSPVQVGSLTDWRYISDGGGWHTLATKTDGTLWSWGRNSYGGLGLNDKTHRSSPVQVGSLTNWENISTGDTHSISTKTDGTLWSWGENAKGQLGLGNITNRSSPVQVGNITDWYNLDAGFNHSMVLQLS